MELITNDSVNKKEEFLSGSPDKVVRRTMQHELNKQIAKNTKAELQKFLNSPVAVENEEDEDRDDDNFDHEMMDDETDIPLSGGLGDPENPDTAKILKEIEKADRVDIFTDQGDKWFELGQLVRYDIYKNKALIEKVDHPFSWEKVQAKFGKGHYKVVAKLPANKNRYLGAQSKLIENLVTNDSINYKNNRIDQHAQQQGVQGMSASETIALLEAKNRQLEESRKELELRLEERLAKSEQKIREEYLLKTERDEKFLEKMTANALVSKPKDLGETIKELTPLITVLAPFFKKEKDTSLADALKLINEQNTKMMEKSEKNIEKMIEVLTNTLTKKTEKSDSISPLEVMKMVQDAENKGFEKWKEMSDLIDEKAEERAQAMSGGNDGGEKDSITETLIKGLVPALPSLLAGRQAAPQLAAPVAQIPHQPQRLPPRVIPTASRPVNTHAARPVPPQPRSSVSPASAVPRPANAQTRVNESQASTTQKTESRANNQNGQKVGQAHQSGAGLMPKNDPKSFLNSGTTNTIEQNVSTAIMPEVVGNSFSVKEVNNEAKIKEVVFSSIATVFAAENPTIEGAKNHVISQLINSGIDLTTVPRDFDDETLSDTLSVVPEEFHSVLKELHNEIIKTIITQY